MRIPRKVALLCATSVLLVLALPASSALSYTAAERRAEKRQNDRTRKIARDVNTLKNQLGPLPAELAKLGPLDDRLKALEEANLDGRLKVIEGAAPQILKGLSDLRDGSLALKAGLEDAGEGLKQLKDGLEQAGDGLTQLKTLSTSTEYGVGQVFVGGTPLPGAFLTTPDIPDAVHQAQAMGTFLATGAGTITVRVAIRSAETDGDGTTPAAHCRVTATGSGGTTTTSKPNAALGNAPFWPINTKSAQTSTDPANAGFPFGPKTSGADADTLVDLTDISGGGNAVAPGGGGTEAASTGAGQAITVQLACVDTSPSTSDPSA